MSTVTNKGVNMCCKEFMYQLSTLVVLLFDISKVIEKSKGSNLTVYTLGSQNSSEKEVSKEGLSYTGTVRGYCNGRLCNRRI